MANFNYFDELKYGTAQQWISYLNQGFMELSSPRIKIFKLNKTSTELKELYGEVKYSRIYLPPFEMRAWHLDNTWRQVLGEGTMPYLETQETMQFGLNFDEMVRKHRELKTRHITDIYITYTGNSTASIEKNENNLTIYVNGSQFVSYDVSKAKYNTTKKLVSELNTLPEIKATHEGDNDKSTSLVDFSRTQMRGRVNIFSQDPTFSNITDVIEQGDTILTHNFFLYEVMQNRPGGDFGWDYALFLIDAQLRTLDEAQLPQNFIEQIKRQEYGLRDRFHLEGEVE